jgi:hypothetical protein
VDRERIVRGFASSLGSVFKDANVKVELRDADGNSIGYYKDIRFHIYAPSGKQAIELVDGGVTDWTARLLSNNKERVVISGIGTENLLRDFGQLRVAEKR